MDVLPDDAPAPRLCHLIKWPDFDGYGFNLHAERSNPGQFIGKIDDDSPAQMAGLREGDKIIEVNGVNISNENHRQVVERIKADPQETKLLVVDQETDLWYKEQDIVIKSSQMNVVYVKTPYPRPLPDSPRAKFHQQHHHHHSSVSGETNTNTTPPTTTDTGSSIAHSDSNHQQQQQVSLSPSTVGGSSLETSDFNEDSIEQQQIIKKQQEAAQKSLAESPIKQTSVANNNNSNSKTSPPMSPDSGKGDEEPANVVTIEAEINRQSPHKQQLMQKANENDDQDEEEEDFKKEQQIGNVQVEENQQDDDGGAKSISNSIEPDSLSGQSSKKSPPNSCQINQMKGGSFNAMNKVRNGSADSGKSSSPDTGSSGSGSDASIADSLEDNNQSRGGGGKEKLPNGLDEDDVLTIKNYQDAAALSKSVISSNNNNINNNNNNNNNNNDNENSHDIIKTSTPTIQDASGEIKPQNLSEEENSLKKTTSSSVVTKSENNTKVDSQLDKSHSDPLKQETKNQQQQQVNNSTTTTNNNYSGLNLNMTASEMRELIARRKKFDPKKAQMNIRQKYEIIQQM